MADSQRLSVQYDVLHHAVTPLWSDKSVRWLAQWFSDNGFVRGYGSGSIPWSGLINPYTGARSYAQAHFAGQIVTASTPDATASERKAGYRLVPLVKDPWGQITWGAGNWEVNRACINIENLGDYRNYTLRDGDCKVLADFWRPHDQKLKGATFILGHQEVFGASTACPARIMEKRNLIVDMINNPKKYEPKPIPKPVITTKEEIKSETIPYTKENVDDERLLVGDNRIIPGHVGTRTIVYTVTYTDGKETKRVVKSDETTEPVNEITVIGTLVVPEPPKPIDTSWLDKLIRGFVKFIMKFFRRTK